MTNFFCGTNFIVLASGRARQLLSSFSGVFRMQ